MEIEMDELWNGSERGYGSWVERSFLKKHPYLGVQFQFFKIQLLERMSLLCEREKIRLQGAEDFRSIPNPAIADTKAATINATFIWANCVGSLIANSAMKSETVRPIPARAPAPAISL